MTADQDVHLAWVALGSNIAPQRNLPQAVFELQRLGHVCNVSSVWESRPVGDLQQPNFCNAAVLLETVLSPGELKQGLRDIEHRLGRIRDPQNRNAARTIDLDIAFFDRLVIHTPQLQIPDPEISQRPFLAVPLAELDGDFLHPVLQQTLSQIAGIVGGARDLKRRDDILLLWAGDAADGHATGRG